MSDSSPSWEARITSETGRVFACFPVAVVAIIVDRAERLLLLTSPTGHGGWEVISGALEANEALMDGVLREISEEAGPEFQVRPLGVVHAYSFDYDTRVRRVLGICCLMEYLGGSLQPGSDAADAEFRWWTIPELEAAKVQLDVPRDKPWILQRAVEMYRVWRDQPAAPLA